jgi:hypothetical protein
MGASVLSASAADLGGLTAGQLSVYSGEVSIDLPDPPGALADDSFAGCHGRLDNREDSTGNVWTDHGGDWHCLGNEVVRAQIRQPLAHASLEVGRSDDIVISTSIADISHQGGRSGPGIALFTDGSFHLYVIYERDLDRLTLGRTSPWANAALVSVPMAERDSLEMSVVIDQPTLTVVIDGAVVMTYDLFDLTCDEQGYFLARTRFGLESDLDNQSRFDNFRVEVLP